MPSLEDAIEQGKPLKEITRLLDGSNLTPYTLYLAVCAGREDIVTLLLDRRANINEVDHTYGPVLTEAVYRGSMAMVSLLLERGADINLDSRHRTPLAMAVTGGNVDIVSLLLDRGADINLDGGYGTPLAMAVKVGNEAIVSLLLDRGVDINLDGRYGTPPLAIAVKEGNAAIVSLLLDRGADINLEGGYGAPLATAVEVGNEAIVSLLLDRGADINLDGRYGTALTVAVRGRMVAIMLLLLDRGAHINLDGRYGTPLVIAVGRKDVAIVSLLLDRGADINLDGGYGTPLATAVKVGNEAIVSLLLDRGADINLDGRYGTALTVAVRGRMVAIMLLLLDRGADINLDGLYGTPLVIAIGRKDVAIVSLLLDQGADINLEGGYGAPLAIAIKEGDAAADIVSLLLDRGANINLDGRYGTPLAMAVTGGNAAIVSLLLDRGADINLDGRYGTLLAIAVKKGNAAIVSLLLDRGADINLDGRYGTPLAIAVKEGNAAIVTLLLDRGADINLDGRCGTPLAIAARRDNVAIVSLLQDRGADINKVDHKYGTALTVAARVRSVAIVSLLLDRGADINMVGGTYQTPLSAAVFARGKDVASLLLDRGADINVVYGKFGTVLAQAIHEGMKEIVLYLLERGADVLRVGGSYSTPLGVYPDALDAGLLKADPTLLAPVRAAVEKKIANQPTNPYANPLISRPPFPMPYTGPDSELSADHHEGTLPLSQISSLDMQSIQFYADEDISPQQSNFLCQELHADILGDLLAALVGLDKDTTQAKRQWIQNDARYFIARNFDFGLAYAAARVAWKDFNSVDFDMISLQRAWWHKHAQKLDEARSTAIEIDCSQELILSPYSIMPRRLWDLKSNRVVNFQMLHAVQPIIENPPNFWAVTHSWTSDMSPVWTAINEYQWPVPLPKSLSFEHLRSELLKLGAEYVWIDVVCLRQQSGVDYLDRLKEEEWKLDVPTIGNIYRAAKNIVRYFNGLGVCFSNEGWDNERHWLQRAWTLQEIANENTTINGGIPPDLDCTFLNSRSKGLKEVIKLRSAIRPVIKLAAQVDSEHGCEVYQLAREMARRHATQPLDKLSGLFYLLHMTKLPCYYEGATDETIWRQNFHLLHVNRKAEILLNFPYRGSDEQWFPTWAQLLDWPVRDPECDHMRFQISLGLMRDLSGGKSFFIRDIWTISDASIDEISPGEYKVKVNKTPLVFHFFLPYLSQKPINIEGQPVFTLVAAVFGHSYNWMVCRAIGKRAGIDYNLEEAEVNVLKKVGVFRTDYCGELLVHGLLEKRDWLFI